MASTVKTISASQTSANPASRAGGIGSWNNSTPSASCRTGVRYCRMPSPTSGTRLAAPANSSSGIAVAAPASSINVVCSAETCPNSAPPVTFSQVR